MKTYKRLDKYRATWLPMPAYHVLTPKNWSNEDVSQWIWKEMKEFSFSRLGVVTQTGLGRSPTERSIFNHAINYTQTMFR
jgi:hypothetical protein